ncbi:MAG: NUDIX hydrolase, partial [Candidatus Thiodiazotropha sp.]
MKYCSHCGAEVGVKVPEGDNRPRYVCDSCSTVHYQNPKIVVGCIPVWEQQILLCRRAIEPRYGLWTVPAGFMENGETSQQGAARVTLEEACARVEIDG